MADLIRPLVLDSLLSDLDDLLGQIAAKGIAKAGPSDERFLVDTALRAARGLVNCWLSDVKLDATAATSKGAAVRVEDAWRRGMIETVEERARRVPAAPIRQETEGRTGVDILDEEMATYRDRRHALLREHEGKFVLIKGPNVLGVFGDRSTALREGYNRLGVVPFLVRQVAASDPLVYLPNVAP